jgi:hypothetical protein
MEMTMHVRASRERSERFELPSTTDGVQRLAAARRAAVAHCLAHALAVRILRRHSNLQKACVDGEQSSEA